MIKAIIVKVTLIVSNSQFINGVDFSVGIKRLMLA